MIITFLLGDESIHNCTECEELENIKAGEEIIIKGTKYTIDKIDISINGKISKKVYLTEV